MRLKNKLPNKAYILFIMCEGSIPLYNVVYPTAIKFLEAIKNHEK